MRVKRGYRAWILTYFRVFLFRRHLRPEWSYVLGQDILTPRPQDRRKQQNIYGSH